MPHQTESPISVTADELGRADRLARRLHGEISSFLAALPPEARNASGLARHLAIDRTTCQRAVFVASRPYPGVDVLGRLPGVRALQQLIAAATRAGADDAVVASLSVAVEQFQMLLQSFGGSQSRLVRHLNRTPLGFGAASVSEPTSGQSGSIASRMRLFDAAAELTGRSSTCWVAVYVYRPIAGDAHRVELIRATGLVGHVARADAVPLLVHNFTTKAEDELADVTSPAPGRFMSLGNEPLRARALDSILPEFTTQPPPIVNTRQPNEFLVQSIDEPTSLVGHPVDLMMATRTAMPHPATSSPPVEEAWALVNFPCRHLLFDVYLHRDLARSCIPSLDAHLWRPDFAQHAGSRWQTRFADSPPLQLLGRGLRSSPTPAYPRLGELTRTVFSRVGLSGDDFVGYRCEVAYPIWRAGYCVSFDFTRPEQDDAGAAMEK